MVLSSCCKLAVLLPLRQGLGAQRGAGKVLHTPAGPVKQLDVEGGPVPQHRQGAALLEVRKPLSCLSGAGMQALVAYESAHMCTGKAPLRRRNCDFTQRLLVGLDWWRMKGPAGCACMLHLSHPWRCHDCSCWMGLLALLSLSCRFEGSGWNKQCNSKPSAALWEDGMLAASVHQQQLLQNVSPVAVDGGPQEVRSNSTHWRRSSEGST